MTVSLTFYDFRACVLIRVSAWMEQQVVVVGLVFALSGLSARNDAGTQG
jgi:hypothetical protein